MSEKSGNLLIMQVGESSSVCNSSLYGAITEALNYEQAEEIYGVRGGFKGILGKEYIDLAGLMQQKVRSLLHTTGHALNELSSETNFEALDWTAILKELTEKEIKWVVIIGDRNAIQGAKFLSHQAEANDLEIKVLAVPHSYTNDLPVNNHSLGYGSALKYLAAKMTESEIIASSEASGALITEIQDGVSGWLTAGACLAKGKRHKDANPYIICLPEQPFEEEKFLTAVEKKLNQNGHVMVVTHNILVDLEGEYISFAEKGGSAAAYLSSLIKERFDFDSDLNYINLKYGTPACFISEQDRQEAINCGAKAVKLLIEDEDKQKAVVVLRGDENHSFELKAIPLQEMLDGTKFFPPEWIVEDEFTLSYSFVKYANPLIQGEIEVPFERGVPKFGHLI